MPARNWNLDKLENQSDSKLTQIQSDVKSLERIMRTKSMWLQDLATSTPNLLWQTWLEMESRRANKNETKCRWTSCPTTRTNITHRRMIQWSGSSCLATLSFTRWISAPTPMLAWTPKNSRMQLGRINQITMKGFWSIVEFSQLISLEKCSCPVSTLWTKRPGIVERHSSISLMVAWSKIFQSLTADRCFYPNKMTISLKN